MLPINPKTFRQGTVILLALVRKSKKRFGEREARLKRVAQPCRTLTNINRHSGSTRRGKRKQKNTAVKPTPISEAAVVTVTTSLLAFFIPAFPTPQARGVLKDIYCTTRR